MQFLRGSTLHLYNDLLPHAGSTLTNRTVNYLSFYLSYNGLHQYYSPHLHSQQYLYNHFAQIDQQLPFGNNDHLFAKMLLAVSFPEHVVDLKGTFRIISDLYALSEVNAKDIVESFLKVKCKDIRHSEPIKMATKPLPAEKRRNIYVSHARTLPGLDELTQMITLNPFYRLPNLNKIMVFSVNPSQPLQLTTSLQRYCHDNSVKIKLLERPTCEALLEYIYTRTRGKILIHENINYDKTIYDLQTPPEKQRTVNKKVINKLNNKIMPQEILLMSQRLPKDSLATKQTKNQVLTKMRELLDLEEGEDLIDPVKRIAMSNIEKNYKHEESYLFTQSKLGFLLRRYVTEEVYALERKSDVNTPFTNPK